MPRTVHVAVVEFAPEDDLKIYIGDTWLSVAQPAASAVMPDEGSHPPADWPEVETEHPLTLDVWKDEERLREWHDTFRGNVTQPWVTFVTRELPDLPEGA